MPSEKIRPCLWFDDQAEEATGFYVSLFKDSRLGNVVRYGEGAHRPAGSVMTVEFELAGRSYIALNGGPYFKFNEAVSLSIDCETQAEIDELWDKLCEGGSPSQCGWLKDRWGLSWQIVPSVLRKLLADPDATRVKRVVDVVMTMTKLDIAQIEQAANGSE